MFQSFIDQLESVLNRALPGEDAQFLMAPLKRERIKEIPKENFNPRRSAVLILLFPFKDRINTVFIQRPEYDGVHSGQVAFPGGKYEEADVELKQTALREAFEEVGAPSQNIKILGSLTDVYITPSNFLVTPFVGYINTLPDFIADPREVQKIIIADLFGLNAEGIKGIKTITHSNGYKRKTPYYEIEGLTIWGATAMIISELNAVIDSISF